MHNVCKLFNNVPVLNNINLIIEQSIVGLAGPSGSGKSTLLRCIQKLEVLDSGSIECNDSTGFVFQDFQLFSHMTVWENLTYAPKLKNKLRIKVIHYLSLWVLPLKKMITLVIYPVGKNSGLRLPEA